MTDETLLAAATIIGAALKDGLDNGISVSCAIDDAFQSRHVTNYAMGKANVVDVLASQNDVLRGIANAIEGLSSTLGRIAGLSG